MRRRTSIGCPTPARFMDWTLFQLAIAAVLAVAYGLLFRQTPRTERGRLLTLILLIAVTSWLGEDTSIRRYAYYGYPDAWWLVLDQVPLLVVAIWPLVILTSDQVVRALFPDLSRLGHAAAVAVMVLIDASLIETVAVAANLWFWVEGGYLGVPLAGMVGWAAYAFSIALFLPGVRSERPIERRLAVLSDRALGRTGWLEKMTVLIVSLAVTHALIILTWWALLRHTLRYDLPEASIWVAVGLSIALTAWLWRRGRKIPLDVAGPRALATSVFIVLLALYADGPVLYIHFAAIALPYLALIDVGRSADRGHRPAR